MEKVFFTANFFMLTGGTSFFLLSFTHSHKVAGDVRQQLGISRGQGTDNIKQSFPGVYLYYYGAKNAKNIADGNCAAVAKDLLNYTETAKAFAQGWLKELK
jgi:hypothetical protein